MSMETIKHQILMTLSALLITASGASLALYIGYTADAGVPAQHNVR